jgi:hypothetical protein
MKIKLIAHDEKDQTITVSLSGSSVEYVIKYGIDEDGFKYLWHNSGYCAGTSDLSTDYPENNHYDSDSELNAILEKV